MGQKLTSCTVHAGSAKHRDRGTETGSFIVDGKGTILGFDQGMETLTGWRAIDVVGQHKDLARARLRDERGERRVARLPLYDGSLPSPSRSGRVELRLGCRDGESIEVEAVTTHLPGAGERIVVNVLRVLACLGRPASPGEPVHRDELTGLVGPEAFGARLTREFREAASSARPIALILADVDLLRRVNDRLGRRAGDEVLRKLAGVLRAAVGDDELVARLGSDNFAILLPDAGRGEARQVAARLRSTVERLRFLKSDAEENPLRVTLSLGAASFPADAESDTDLMDRARDALDEARSLGRNRVWCYMRRPRVPLHAPVYFDGVEPMLVGFTRDLSPSGIFIETPVPIEIGMRCAFAFPLPEAEGNVHVVGRVVRAVARDEAAELPGKRTPGMAVEFEKLGTDDRRAIEGFLHRHESQTLRPENGTFSVG